MQIPEPHDSADRPAPPSSAASARRAAVVDGVAVDGLTPVPHLERKAGALLLFTLLLILGSAFYLMYARGVFEPKQSLILTADDSEGVSIGLDMTFSGFAIGKVSKIELAPDGTVRIHVDVPEKDAHWLRSSSVFTLVKGLVGGTTIKAYSGILDDPQLEDGAVRAVLSGDATAELPQLMSNARQLLENLNMMTSAGSALGGTLEQLRDLSTKLNGPSGALGVVMGGDAEARKISQTLDRTNQLLARLDGLAKNADKQVFGADGVMPEVRATVQQLNAVLGDVRGSLKKVDAVLVEAQAVGANAKDATSQLGDLRADVEANLRKVEGMLTELNRKWPFAKKDAEVRLP
ncbi:MULTISPECIES: MlaD family protein [Comamonas]|jgi:phospholipid/cholesterol/gamma-HCH transport system substrate-binding protein|uniref:MlaD family protein n=1 Tax=Comamonas sediminis TaxID=1783360 RepID=A0ABV4AY05_9BURK|nr:MULTISPECIES: MlaD family protein [unclassified Comamonas]ULR90029.1 MlaD family protein [Comamonas sp. B21-038]